jgi:diaminopimelate decarboxylase
MQLADGIEDHFPSCNGDLLIGGVTAGTLAEQFGTPLFVYDQSIMERKWKVLRSIFPGFDIHYSVKANPNLNVLAFFLAQGAGLEIASAGELYQAREAGCPAHRMVFAGPGKTPAEIHHALCDGVGELHAESLVELEKIATVAEHLGQRAPVAVRINPEADVQGGAMRMGGKPAPFGIDEELLDSALDVLLSRHSLEFRGIHLFAGTQILDAQVLLAQYRKGVEVAKRVVARTGKPLHSLDFGGGLGVPYFSNEHPLNAEELSAGVAELEETIASDPDFAGTRRVIEPGRYLIAEAGVYLSRVLDVKQSRGKKFAILDGGMNHHLAASGNLGQTIKRNFPIAVANKRDEPEGDPIEIVGPLCTPLDTLGRAVTLPTVEVGDLIAVFQSGAYARTASPLGFLSHPSPPEVMVDAGEARLIRKRGEPSDYCRDIQFAEPIPDSAMAKANG